MKPFKQKNFVIALWVFLALLISGFSFSDPQKLKEEIRKEIKAELEKIIEKTPSARLRAQWRAKRDEAKKSLDQGLLFGAPKFCPKDWDQAVELFNRSKRYAAKRSYRKAIYLSKKAIEYSTKAKNCAKTHLDKRTKKLLKEYSSLRENMDDIRALVPPGAEELFIKASNISLAIEDLKTAINMRDFDQADDMVKKLEKRLKKLKNEIIQYRKEHQGENGEEGL